MTIVNSLQEIATLEKWIIFCNRGKKNYTNWKLVHKTKRIPWDLQGWSWIYFEVIQVTLRITFQSPGISFFEEGLKKRSLLNPGALARVSVPYFDWLALSMYIQVITWTVPGRFITDEENRERGCQGMVNTETFWLEISPCSDCKCGQLRYYSSLEINHCLRTGSYSTASLTAL